MTNVNGGSGDVTRGTWCTPKRVADALPEFDLDPCSNPRSNVRAKTRLMLENGDDGLAYGLGAWPWSTRTFINPPYGSGQVIKWIEKYKHTNFTFLLRFDPSTKWFSSLIDYADFIAFPVGWRINFEPPPGVSASSSTMPHALFMDRMPTWNTDGWMVLAV